MSDLFPQSAREYELQRIAAALGHEQPDAPPETLPERAAGFLAVADRYDVPFEALIAWVHNRDVAKQWSLAECRAWCEKYVETMRELKLEREQARRMERPAEYWDLARCAHGGELLETAAAAAGHICRRACKSCAHEMRRENGRWKCPNCGEEG